MKFSYKLLYWPNTGPVRELATYPSALSAMDDAPGTVRGEWEPGKPGTVGERGFWISGDKLERSQRWGVIAERNPETHAEAIQLAVELAFSYGQDDGGHHKMWVIDQMVRVLLGDEYERAVVEFRDGEDGPDTYAWDEGIAP